MRSWWLVLGGASPLQQPVEGLTCADPVTAQVLRSRVLISCTASLHPGPQRVFRTSESVTVGAAGGADHRAQRRGGHSGLGGARLLAGGEAAAGGQVACAGQGQREGALESKSPGSIVPPQP